jgi:hypothetical protein
MLSYYFSHILFQNVIDNFECASVRVPMTGFLFVAFFTNENNWSVPNTIHSVLQISLPTVKHSQTGQPGGTHFYMLPCANRTAGINE